MRVTIVTVNRNYREGLRRTLESVRAQTYDAFEHIVIDGASTDGSADLLRGCTPAPDRWVSEPDGGIYAAMNKGIRWSRGDYIQFLNSGDTLATPEVLARVFSEAVPAAEILYGNTLYPDGPHRVREIRYPERLSVACYFLRWGVCHQSMFFRRALFDRIGFYDETLRLLGDWDLSLRALLGGHVFQHLSMPVACYEAGGLSSRAPKLLASEKEIVFRRHLPAAIYEDYQRLAFPEAEHRRLASGARQAERMRQGCLLANYGLVTRWFWERLRTAWKAPRAGSARRA